MNAAIEDVLPHVLAAAAPATEPCQVYDFRRAGTLSRAQCRLLNQHFSGLARRISGSFTDYLRVPVGMALADVDSVTYGEVFRTPQERLLQFVFSPGSSQPCGVLQVSVNVLYGMLELLMGGTTVTPIHDKKFTEFDRAVMADLGGRMLSLFAECAPPTMPLEPLMLRTELDERLIPRTQDPEALMVRITLAISLEGCTGRVVYCLPYEAVRLSLRSAAPGLGRGQPMNPAPERIEEVAGLQVTLTVELGRANCTGTQLMRMQPGDVFFLSGAPLARIGTVPKYRVRPGMVGDHLAVEIARTIAEDEI